MTRPHPAAKTLHERMLFVYAKRGQASNDLPLKPLTQSQSSIARQAAPLSRRDRDRQ